MINSFNLYGAVDLGFLRFICLLAKDYIYTKCSVLDF